MNRRAFLTGLLATAGGVLVPWEPRRVYSFGSEVGLIPREEVFALIQSRLEELFERRARGLHEAFFDVSLGEPFELRREVIVYKTPAVGMTTSVLEDALRERPIARMQRRFGEGFGKDRIG